MTLEMNNKRSQPRVSIIRSLLIAALIVLILSAVEFIFSISRLVAFSLTMVILLALGALAAVMIPRLMAPITRDGHVPTE